MRKEKNLRCIMHEFIETEFEFQPQGMKSIHEVTKCTR